MSIVIKGFGISIVGVLAIGLLGCGCLFPSTFHGSNPHSALYSDLYKAQDLRESGRYKAALAKYEQVSKKHLQSAFDRKVIHVGVLMHLKYSIAFCYTQLAEVEGDVSLYSKAEAAATECYETAINPSNRADALYLWGYILFKQARYEEAGTKFKALLETFLEVDALFALGKVYLELGDEVVAQRVYAQLEQRPPPTDGPPYMFLYDHYETLVALGKVYLELGDEAAARRVLAQLEELIKTHWQKAFYHVGHDFLYGLGKAYLELGDEVAARHVFTQLLEHYPNSLHKAEVQRFLGK